MTDKPSNTTFYAQVVDLLQSARQQVVHSVNQTMVLTYFEIGRKMRGFYLLYGKSTTPLSKSNGDEISETLPQVFNLSWSHYLKLMRIDDERERKFYEIESYKNNWSVRELRRQFDSALYIRLVLSRDKDKVKELSEKGLVLEKPKDAIKDPYILEFIGLPEHAKYSESQLEQKLIDKLEHFLLELGNGFTFVGRMLCVD